MAKRTKISSSILSCLENGEMSPSPDDLEKFARIYSVDYNERMIIVVYRDSNGHTIFRRILADASVTEEEAEELWLYLKYLCWRSKQF